MVAIWFSPTHKRHQRRDGDYYHCKYVGKNSKCSLHFKPRSYPWRGNKVLPWLRLWYYTFLRNENVSRKIIRETIPPARETWHSPVWDNVATAYAISFTKLIWPTQKKEILQGIEEGESFFRIPVLRLKGVAHERAWARDRKACKTDDLLQPRGC